MQNADAIVVGAGLAGLVAAVELGARGKRVIVVDQEPPQFLGGQAFWSLGGLFMVGTPEQHRMGIKDSYDLALRDWMGSAQFDRPEDLWPRIWAESYIHFAATHMRDWLHGMGMRWFPVVGWAERGGSSADGHGNSVPRFHLTWGTGPGVLAPFLDRLAAMQHSGLIQVHHRHRVDQIEMQNGAAVGVSGAKLGPDDAPRGASTHREIVGSFAFHAPSVIVASGGIGGDLDKVRNAWPRDRLGDPPDHMVAGVPAHVDGRMISIASDAGGNVINNDRMWHYTEGVKNWDPIWPNHGIRILPGPSSLWVDADGNRLPPPCLPGFDTLTTLREILRRGHSHTWFVLTQSVIKKEFALSGSEQNPDFTSADWREVLRQRVLSGRRATGPVEAFKEHGEDFVVADDFEALLKGMHDLDGGRIDGAKLKALIAARDSQVDNPFAKDPQIAAIHAARNYRGDRLIRTAKPHRFLDPAHGPLIAVRLHVLTRKTLGGLETDLETQVIGATGAPVPGLFAVGEAAGFGGGGYHGYNALEGTFLGGCLYSGRRAGRSDTVA